MTCVRGQVSVVQLGRSLSLEVQQFRSAASSCMTSSGKKLGCSSHSRSAWVEGMGKVSTAVAAAKKAAKTDTGKKKRVPRKPLTEEELRNKVAKSAGNVRKEFAAKLRVISQKNKEKRRKEKIKLRKQGIHVPQGVTHTTESLRRPDDAANAAQDEEIAEIDEVDEFATYFSGEVTPKIMITTCRKPATKVKAFVQEFQICIPNVFYYKRGEYRLRSICKYAANNGFTDLIVVTQHKNLPRNFLVIHLPEGPTAYFKMSSLVLARDMKGSAAVTDHKPEVLFRNFDTALGKRVGRSLAALFPQDPEFRGRRVITFLNQRDFIFVRHHRYVFNEDGKRCRLQEIGPRFCLKLHAMQQGTFDPEGGDFEFSWRPDMNVDRKKMFT